MKHKQICSKCGNKMRLIGITDRGYYKYYCNNCYNIQEEEDNN